MKTTIKILVALLALAAGMAPAAAQDTIHSTALPANVYDINWPDSLLNDSSDILLSNLYGSSSSEGRIGVLKHTDEPFKVYGIAAALFKYNELLTPAQLAMTAHQVEDTVTFYDEKLFLWQIDGGDVQQVGECLTANVGLEAPQYYWDLGLILDIQGTPFPIMPMYERYFQEPILVHDTFMVGKGYSNGLPSGKDGCIYKNWDVLVPAIQFADLDRGIIISAGTDLMVYFPDNKPPVGGVVVHRGWEIITRNKKFDGHVVLFPIIAPNPDTARTGIGHMTPVERNTVVSPNPATGTVRVASGFGLLGIEVYDAAGRRIYSADANGMQTSIDVASWPRGAYTVHVRTAVGTAIKKLLVQ